MTLAIFDLDNTLLAGDSDYSWGQFLVDRNIVDRDYYEAGNRRFYQQYRQGILDILEFQAFALKPLTEHPLQQLHRWRAEFIHDYIQPMITDKARQLVEKHRDRGDTLLVITATSRFVAEPIIAQFNIPNLLATDPEIDENGYTGRVTGIPCFQEGKVKRLNLWLEAGEESLAGAWFYSDSSNDLPLLQVVDHPCAVDPDNQLRAHAEAQGWPVISLRD